MVSREAARASFGYRLKDRRVLVQGGAFAVVALFHGLLLINWQRTHTDDPIVIGRDPGAAGISLALVSASAGEPSRAAVADGTDAASASVAANPPDQTEPGPEHSPSVEAASPSPAASASQPDHPDMQGADATGSVTVATASPGTGGDPWARASFAASAPPADVLWDRVQRCYVGELPAQAQTFNVLLGDDGAPARTIPMPGSVVSPAETQVVDTAVKACGPFADVRQSLGASVVIVVPSRVAPPAVS